MKDLQIVFYIVLLCSSGASYANKLSVDDFLADPDVYDVAISPNGRYLADIRQHGELRIATIRDLDAPGWPKVGQLGDDIIRPYSLMWVNDDRLLIHLLVPLNTKTVRKQSEEKEDFDIDDYYMASRTIAVNRDGKESVMLMNDTGRVRGNWNLSMVRRIQSDSKNVLMPAFAGEKLTLFKVNVYDGASQVVVSGGRRTFAFVCDKDGQPLYRLDVSDFGKAMKVYKLENGEWGHVEKIELDEEDESGGGDLGDLVGLAKDGGLLYRKRNEKTGYYEILKRHAKDEKNEGKTETVVSLPDRDVLSLIVDEVNDEVIGYRVEDDVFRNRYFEKDRQAEYDKLRDRLAGYAFHFHSIDREGRRGIVRSYGPGSYFIYDRKQGGLSVYANEYGRLKLEDMAEPAVATYATRDKAKIRAYILLPPGYRPGQVYPMVVMVHGGPHLRSYALYDNFAQFIATRGYVVVEPNFRGSTGYGLEFEKVGYKQWGRLMQDDLDDAVAFMVKKGFADPNRVCIAGGSYGGYAALMGLIKNSGTYKCAISINGVTHLRDQVKFNLKRFSDSRELVERVRETMGDPDADREYLDTYSPMLRAAEIKSPLLLIAGEKDKVVPFNQSKGLAKTLKRSKANITFLPLENAGHNVFYYRDHREKIYKAVEEFLQKNL
jgi:dipeptidyl aminopeptidase/acylaminoacyl peptidase